MSLRRWHQLKRQLIAQTDLKIDQMIAVTACSSHLSKGFLGHLAALYRLLIPSLCITKRAIAVEDIATFLLMAGHIYRNISVSGWATRAVDGTATP